MKQAVFDLKEKLTPVDLDVLYNIYLLRCLTLEQIHNYFYEDIPTFRKFIDTKKKRLMRYKVVEEVSYGERKSVLFLTKLGIDLVLAFFDLPLDIVDVKNGNIKRGYYRPSELKMLPRLIPHQVHLNQFVLDFKKSYQNKGLSARWKYFDEKYVSQYINIRPDGLIRLLDIDFFLEMDMATESKAQLLEKWKNYRMFLTSNEYKYNERKILVLFIIENTNNIENRKNLVKVTASEILMDIIDNNFDIIIGTKEELMQRMFEVIIPDLFQTNYNIERLKKMLTTNHNFNVAGASSLRSKLNNTEYDFYIRKLNENNIVVTENGRLQEFLLDYYYGDNLSVIKRISYLQQNSSSFKYYFNREINLIIVCDDLHKTYNDLKLFNLHDEDKVYFTTIDRLKSLPFNKALCKFDKLGRLYSFTNSSLYYRVYEDN